MVIRFHPMASPKIIFVLLCFFLLAVQLKLSEAVEEEGEEETLGHRNVRQAQPKKCKGKDKFACVPLGCNKCYVSATADAEEGAPFCQCKKEISPEAAIQYQCSAVTDIPETKPANSKKATAENCAYQCSQYNDANPAMDYVANFCEAVTFQGEKLDPTCACTPPPEEPPTTSTTTEATTDDTIIAQLIQLVRGILDALIEFLGSVLAAVTTFIQKLPGLVNVLKLLPDLLQPVVSIL